MSLGYYQGVERHHNNYSYIKASEDYAFCITRISTNTTPTMKIEVKIALLFLANQLGRKISKFASSELEYFLAINVSGQNILKMNNTNPSPMINPIPIQVKEVIVLVMPE
jgi:hypothetical protein